MSEDAQVSAKVLVKRLRGLESEVIADTVPANQAIRLDGADAARVFQQFEFGQQYSPSRVPFGTGQVRTGTVLELKLSHETLAASGSSSYRQWHNGSR